MCFLLLFFSLLFFPGECPQNVSWCKVECSVNGLAAVGVASEQAPPPPLTVLSLSVKTVLNTATHTNEVW